MPDTAEEEFRNAWNAAGRVLKEAGVGYNQIIEDTTFHVNMHDHLGQFMKVRDEFLSEPWSAWTVMAQLSWQFRGLGRRDGWWRVIRTSYRFIGPQIMPERTEPRTLHPYPTKNLATRHLEI